jgi:hypothetical protein
VYTTTGVYTWHTSFTSFYQYSAVDWTRGVRTVALILKDDMNRKPSPENVGATISAMYMPTRLRVTVTIVSAGGTYVPPADTMLDGGTAPMDAGMRADAGSSADIVGVADIASDERGAPGDTAVMPAGDAIATRSDVGAVTATDAPSSDAAANAPVVGTCGCSIVGRGSRNRDSRAMIGAVILAIALSRRRRFRARHSLQ